MVFWRGRVRKKLSPGDGIKVENTSRRWPNQSVVLSRSSRLTREQDIVSVIRRGRHIRAVGVDMYISPRTAAPTRIACVVGMRVHAQAVQRHRYQRWLRVLAREVTVPSPGGRWYDMVWVAQPAIKRFTTLALLRQALLAHLTPFFPIK